MCIWFHANIIPEGRSFSLLLKDNHYLAMVPISPSANSLSSMIEECYSDGAGLAHGTCPTEEPGLELDHTTHPVQAGKQIHKEMVAMIMMNRGQIKNPFRACQTEPGHTILLHKRSRSDPAYSFQVAEANIVFQSTLNSRIHSIRIILTSVNSFAT